MRTMMIYMNISRTSSLSYWISSTCPQSGSGLVSPQFHLVFNDEFTTVTYLTGSGIPPNWSHLLQHTTEKVTRAEEDLSNELLHPTSDTITEELFGAGVRNNIGLFGAEVDITLGANNNVNPASDTVDIILGANDKIFQFIL